MAFNEEIHRFISEVTRATAVLHDPDVPAAEARGRAMSCLAMALKTLGVKPELPEGCDAS